MFGMNRCVFLLLFDFMFFANKKNKEEAVMNEKRKENNMEEYIKEIEQIAARCTESQSDGYSQIMRICDAMREEQRY